MSFFKKEKERTVENLLGLIEQFVDAIPAPTTEEAKKSLQTLANNVDRFRITDASFIADNARNAHLMLVSRALDVKCDRYVTNLLLRIKELEERGGPAYATGSSEEPFEIGTCYWRGADFNGPAGDNKISLIKLLRNFTGWGLKECKDVCESKSVVRLSAKDANARYGINDTVAEFRRLGANVTLNNLVP
jgi:hypothetical protein